MGDFKNDSFGVVIQAALTARQIIYTLVTVGNGRR
jgi:hypothetical protein